MVIWNAKLRKFLIIFFSSFLFLELLIRFAPVLFVFIQESRNTLKLNSEKKVVKIVTIGESTTAVAGNKANTFLIQESSYPYLLEQYLNQNSKKFLYKVENKGVMAGTSDLAVDQLSGYSFRNKPDLIVSMFGMKDFAYKEYKEDVKTNFSETLKKISKTYSLIIQLYDQSEIEKSSSDLEKSSKPIVKEFATRAVYRAIYQQGIFEKMQKNSYEVIRENLITAYYASFTGQFERAVNILKKMIKERNFGYFALFEIYLLNNKLSEAEATLLDYKKMAPQNAFAYSRMVGFYLDLGEIEKASSALNQSVALGLGNNLEIIWAKIRIDLYNKNYQRVSNNISKLCGRAAPGKAKKQNQDELLSLLSEKASDYMFYQCSQLSAELDYSQRRFEKAKQALETMLLNESIINFGAAVNLLLKIYEEEKNEEKSFELINRIIRKNKRLGEYYHLINHFKIFNKKLPNAELFEEKIVQLFPKTIASYSKLISYASVFDSKIVVMQYPTFPLSVVKRFVAEAKGKGKEDVIFLSNENVFDNYSKSQVFFEPRFPYNFNHYTYLGSSVIAEHLGKKILEIMEPKK